MKNKKRLSILKVMLAFGLIFLLSACGGKSDTKNESSNDQLKVVSSFSIITDMIEEIGGDYVEVHNLVPLGTDPHEYEPLPEDIKAATDADILFYNGLNLEGGESGWFNKLTTSVNADENTIYEVAKDVEPMYLKDQEGQEEVNPHAFLSPKVGLIMAENIKEALIKELPEHQKDFEDNAENYIKELEKIETEYSDKFNEIPEKERIFIASEQAFQYMTAEYGLKEGFIWAIDTDENGTPDQIQNAIKFVEENNPKVLFVESNVDTRPMETVSDETGVKIFDKKIFADEIGHPGEDGDSYVKFLEYNLNAIIEGLTQ